MKGIIVVNAYAKTASELNQAYRLQDELKKLNVQASIVPADELCVVIEKGSFVINQDFDFCIYLDKDKHIAKMLSKCGIKLFNSADAIEICDDKLLTHVTLANNGVNMPKTIGGVLCYYANALVKDSILDRIERELGYPVIIKQNHGSCGKGVFLAHNRAELAKIADDVKLQSHLFQQYIKASKGVDVRVIVVGGKCVGAMKRCNQNDFRSNIEIGGVGSAIDLPEQHRQLCERVAKLLGLDYCGIDLLTDEHDEALVCEVNSNAFFATFEKVTNINVAEIYAKHIVNCIKNRIQIPAIVRSEATKQSGKDT